MCKKNGTEGRDRKEEMQMIGEVAKGPRWIERCFW